MTRRSQTQKCGYRIPDEVRQWQVVKLQGGEMLETERRQWHELRLERLAEARSHVVPYK